MVVHNWLKIYKNFGNIQQLNLASALEHLYSKTDLTANVWVESLLYTQLG